jgi:hypothetical protein
VAFLGLDFIISSIIWLLVVVLFAFVFRKQLKKFFYKDISFDVFYKNLNSYLSETYPDIKFDFSIIETTKSEPNPNARKYLILDDIINQHTSLKLDSSKYPTDSSQNLQWSSYIFNSEPNRDKIPKDWVKRKNALLIRDNKKCFRCSAKVDLNSIQIHMIRSLENGGKYFLENLIPVCKDCDKILNKKIKHLDIKENLYTLVKGNI